MSKVFKAKKIAEQICKAYPQIPTMTAYHMASAAVYDDENWSGSGHFLSAVKRGDLKDAACRADGDNIKALGYIALVVHRDVSLLEVEE